MSLRHILHSLVFWSNFSRKKPCATYNYEMHLLILTATLFKLKFKPGKCIIILNLSLETWSLIKIVHYIPRPEMRKVSDYMQLSAGAKPIIYLNFLYFIIFPGLHILSDFSQIRLNFDKWVSLNYYKKFQADFDLMIKNRRKIFWEKSLILI